MHPVRPKQGNKKGPRTRANNHNQSWNGPQDMNGGTSPPSRCGPASNGHRRPQTPNSPRPAQTTPTFPQARSIQSLQAFELVGTLVTNPIGPPGMTTDAAQVISTLSQTPRMQSPKIVSNSVKLCTGPHIMITSPANGLERSDETLLASQPTLADSRWASNTSAPRTVKYQPIPGRNQIDELVGERSVAKIEKKKSLAESRWSTTGSTPSHVQVKLDAIAKSDKVVGDPFKTKSASKNPTKLVAVDNDGRDKFFLAAPNGLVNGSLSTPGSIPSLPESRPNSKPHRSDKTTGVPSATKADREKFVAEFEKNGEDKRTPPAQKIEKALTTILEVEVEVEETDRVPVSKVEENAKPAKIDMDEAMVVENDRKRATSLYSHSSKASDNDDIEFVLRKQANFLLAEAAEWKDQAANSQQEHKETKKVHEELDMKFNARRRILETKNRAFQVLESDKKTLGSNNRTLDSEKFTLEAAIQAYMRDAAAYQKAIDFQTSLLKEAGKAFKMEMRDKKALEKRISTFENASSFDQKQLKNI
ncbi:uncharacterized protein RSE6_12277 [Rhynchosporium secalis]|uniref:Uncharacterized protein n=1 Tax=Rhynchosporium secalis TaxID=38038 RepID=A0A1E1MPZ0_RHYSE|nr:uncharacterized protein RSE6_12277 [Rhynchosporium secalis]